MPVSPRAPLAAAALAVLACGGGGGGGSGGAHASAVVTNAGGAVEIAGGPRLEVPPGALAGPTTITIDEAGKSATGAPRWRFGPAGLAFVEPAALRFPAAPDAGAASIYWSLPGDASRFDALPAVPFEGRLEAFVARLADGFVGAHCLEGGACAPRPCHVGAISCAATAGRPTCVDTGRFAPEGATCGGTNVCAAGACVAAPSPTRTVSGTFRVVYRPDGRETVVEGFPRDVSAGPATAVLVPTPAGYARLPVTPGATPAAFSAASVPRGRYFLETEAFQFVPFRLPGSDSTQTRVTVMSLYELTADAPDLSWVSAARPDVLYPSGLPNVSIDVAGLDPWTAGDALLLVSPRLELNLRPTSVRSGPAPVAGASTWTSGFSWPFGGMPDASRGDVMYLSQRRAQVIGSGTDGTAWSRPIRYARVDGVTVADATGGNLGAALAPPAPKGTLRVDARGSRWAALAGAVQPGATLTHELSSGSGFGVLASERSTRYPDMPYGTYGSFGAVSLADEARDHDYGTVAYGDTLGPTAKPWVNAVFAFDFPTSDVRWIFLAAEPVATARSQVEAGSVVGPLVPQIGPPTAPRIEGRDAFTVQAGVGATPTVTWSPPALGAATSYRVSVVQVSGLSAVDELVAVQAVVHGTSFQVPPGLMKPGYAYVASIVAVSAAGDGLDAPPFRRGLPFHSADCVTAFFAP